MHPVAAEAMSRYAQVWDDNERLRRDNNELIRENEVLRGVDKEKSDLIVELRRTLEETISRSDARILGAETHYREEVSVVKRSMERYLRYAVSINERINGCIQDLQAAHEISMDMAHQPTDQPVKNQEKLIAEVEHAVAERTATVEQLQISESTSPRGDI
jgi:hypothetical protein